MWVLLGAMAGLACSVGDAEPHQVDPESTDTIAPGPTTLAAEISREAHKYGDDDSCGDIGALRIDVSATDDETPASALGYRIELAGEYPTRLDTEPVLAQNGRIYLHWSYDPQNHGPWDFDVTVSAIDAAGNEGPPTTVSIRERGTACDTAGSAGWAWILAALAVGRRRRA